MLLARKKTIIRLLILAGTTSIITYLVATFNTPETIYNLDGTRATALEVKSSIINSILFILPALSFLLGLVLALVPFRNWKYIEKIIPAGLVILISLEAGLIILKFI